MIQAALGLSWLVCAAPADETSRIERLENGVRVAIVEDHSTRRVSVQLWLRAGSADDDPSQPGVAQIARTILEMRVDRPAGVAFESRALRDACYFASLAPAERLEELLRLEARRLMPRPPSDADIAAAIQVAAGEPDFHRAPAFHEPLGVAADRTSAGAFGEFCRGGFLGLDTFDESPFGTFSWSPGVSEQILRPIVARAYEGHPYRNPPGIVAASLARADAQRIGPFLEQWFCTGAATVFIVGDVSTPAALELARKYFAPLPWRDAPRRPFSDRPKADRLHIAVPRAFADDRSVYFAFVTPPAGYFETAALDALMFRLCNSVDGPLNRRLRSAGGGTPVWQRGAWRDGGLLVLSAPFVSTQPASAPAAGLASGSPTAGTVDAGQIEHIVFEELERAAAGPCDPVELNRVRALMTAQIRDRRRVLGPRALELAASEIVAGDLLLAGWELARAQSISAGAVSDAAASLLGSRTIIAIAGSASASAPAVDLPPIFYGDVAPGMALQIGMLMPEEPATQPARSAGSRLSIISQPAPGTDSVELRLHVVGCKDRAGLLLLSRLGTKSLSGPLWADYLTYQGMSFVVDQRGDQTLLIGLAPSDHFSALTELLEGLLNGPDLSDENLLRAAAELQFLEQQGGRWQARPVESRPEAADLRSKIQAILNAKKIEVELRGGFADDAAERVRSILPAP